MKLRRRGKKADQESTTVEDLAKLTLKNMKESISSSITSDEKNHLPEVLVLGKTEEMESSDQKETKSNVKRIDLSSSLDPGPLPELYFNTDGPVVTLSWEKEESNEEVKKPLDKSKTARKQRKAERQKVAGDSWFNMPAPEITPEIKNDLKIIQIRNSLDRSHYYKSSDWKKSLPKYFQMGTVIEGPADYYSDRIPKKQRKRTIVEELLGDRQFKKYHTHKYTELQKKRHQQTMLRKKLLNRKKRKLTKRK